MVTWGLIIIAVVGGFFWLRHRGKKARELVAQGAALVDVRTTQEFTGGHLPGAVNIPLHELPARVDEVGPRDRPVVVYCLSGGRSAQAAGFLRSAGFRQVMNLGPMAAW